MADAAANPSQGGMEPVKPMPGMNNAAPAAGANLPGAPGGGGIVDKTVICPPALLQKFIGPGGQTIKKIATDSGAQGRRGTIGTVEVNIADLREDDDMNA